MYYIYKLPQTIVVIIVLEEARIGRAIKCFSAQSATVPGRFLLLDHRRNVLSRRTFAVPHIAFTINHRIDARHRLQTLSDNRKFLLKYFRYFSAQMEEVL